MFIHGSATLSPKDATPFQTAGMVLAGGACVFFGVFYTQLIELMPFTDIILSEDVYFKPYSMSHLTESAWLMGAGFVGFFALKRPLGWLAHHMRDIDAVTYPAAVYLARGSVWGVTELWAAVDRWVMHAIATVEWIGMHPREALGRAGVDVEIRTGIGRSVLFLTLAAGVALFVFVLG